MKYSDEKIDSLREKCKRVFRKLPSPSAEGITRLNGPQIADLKNDFADRNWWTIDDSVIKQNFDKLPLFSSKAHHYFFPAFLSIALREFSEKNVVLEFVLYDLVPKSFDKDREYYEARWSKFSSEEREVIKSFFHLIIEASGLADFHRDARLGLTYWSSQSTLPGNLPQ